MTDMTDYMTNYFNEYAQRVDMRTNCNDHAISIFYKLFMVGGLTAVRFIEVVNKIHVSALKLAGSAGTPFDPKLADKMYMELLTGSARSHFNEKFNELWKQMEHNSPGVNPPENLEEFFRQTYLAGADTVLVEADHDKEIEQELMAWANTPESKFN